MLPHAIQTVAVIRVIERRNGKFLIQGASDFILLNAKQTHPLQRMECMALYGTVCRSGNPAWTVPPSRRSNNFASHFPEKKRPKLDIV